MGSELLSEVPPSYTEQFYALFPYYLSIGMTYDQYWNDNPELVKYYRKAEELRLQRLNWQMWRQGAYFYEAVADNAPIIRAFSKAKEPIPYAKEPYAMTQQEVEQRRERDARERMEKMKEKMIAEAQTARAKKIAPPA